MSDQQAGVESWHCAPVERPACVRCAQPDLGERVGIHYLGFVLVYLVACDAHMLSNCQGHHIPIRECPTLLPTVMV